MAGINKVILVGNLGQKPEVKFASNGNAIANLSVATSESWTDKNTGQKQEKTEWHNISMFGRLAEVGNEYLKKGSQVFIEGRIQTNKSEKDGQTRYFTSIIANQMQMLGSKDNSTASSTRGSNEKSNPSSEKAAPAPAASNFDEFEDDIPF